MVIKTAKPLDNAFIIKAVNNKLSANHRLQRLQDYYEGKHDILLRNYPDPTQPNNKIIVNYCKNIADFLTAYLVGVPVKYEDAPQIILDTLNYNDNDETTQDLIKNMNVFGFGCELFYTDGDGLARFASIDPRESIFIMNDSIEEVLTAFIRVYPKEDKDEGYNVTVYTDKSIVQYDLSLSIGELKAAGNEQAHYFNDVPVVFYPNNKEHTGMFEGIIPLQNALNKIVSDEINDFEGFVNSFLVLTGLQATQKEDMEKMKQDHVLLLDSDSKAEWLIKNVNNTHVKELKDNITKKIRELGCIPDIEDLGSFGASGVALKFKLIPTEIQASKQERVIQRGIQRKLELLYNILHISDSTIGNYTDIKIEFNRNFIMLTDDKIREMEVDSNLVNSKLMSPERFLMKYENFTPEEAKRELKQIQKNVADESDNIQLVAVLKDMRKFLLTQNTQGGNTDE
ncbi:MAG: phage portal protein [Eubacterium sp.]|jgi:SPP1 family phage portal protein|nr:phage portal protein [Eubacterium sp.]